MVNNDKATSTPVTTTSSTNKPDFTKHTAPCQKFIPEARLSEYLFKFKNSLYNQHNNKMIYI